MLKALMMTAAVAVLAVAPTVAKAEDHKEMVAPAATATPAEAAASAATEAAEDGAVVANPASAAEEHKEEGHADDHAGEKAAH